LVPSVRRFIMTRGIKRYYAPDYDYYIRRKH